jgi:hypothetical protein
MTPILQSSPDASYTTAAIGKWSAIEIDIGIICSCLMLLPAFIKYHIPEKWRSYLSWKISHLSRSKSESWKISEGSWPHEEHRYTNGAISERKIPSQKALPLSQVSIELADQGGLLPSTRTISNV